MTAQRKRVVFTFEAPDANNVFLAGSFNNWSTNADPMKKNSEGVWTKAKILQKGVHEYKFIVDNKWILDPSCQNTSTNADGTVNSVITI